MKRATSLSLLLNLVLCAVAAWFWMHPPSSRVTGPAPEPAPVPTKVEPVQPLPAAPARPSPNAPFTWAQLNPDNLQAYVASLRAIACPEATIRNIIIGKVNRQRLTGTVTLAPLDWNPPIPGASSNRRDRNPFTEFDASQRQLLTGLLGENWNHDLRYVSREDRVLLNFLPEDRVLPVWIAAKGIPWPNVARRPSVELSAMLGPAELNELALRASDSAQLMKQSLVGFEPTENEFRAIVIAREFQNIDLNTTLGPQRFAEFSRTDDRIFQMLAVFAHHYQQPIQAAIIAHQIVIGAMNKAEEIRISTTINAASRPAALHAHRESTANALNAALGANCFAALNWAAGFWLDDLEKPASTFK